MSRETREIVIRLPLPQEITGMILSHLDLMIFRETIAPTLDCIRSSHVADTSPELPLDDNYIHSPFRFPARMFPYDGWSHRTSSFLVSVGQYPIRRLMNCDI